MFLSILGYLALAAVGTAIVWKGSDLLEGSSEKLGRHYHLPPVVQGAVIAAVGSSFPELTTTVFSTLIHGKFELGVAAIVGSAIFNILLIPGLAGVLSKEKLKSHRDLVYKEAQFYMIAVAVLLLVFSFAVIFSPVSGGEGVLLGKIGRVLALVPVLLYLLYLFLQWQDTMEYKALKKKVKINVLKEWGWLILSLAIIVVGVEGLIRSAIGLGDILNTPDFLWGLIIIAAGTSIPDLLVSIKSAQKGNTFSSIANVLGSNTFDLLIAIPTGILIAGSAVINFSLAAPMMGILIFATIIFFIFLRTKLEVSKTESWILLFVYLAFSIWMTLETFGVTNLVL